MPSGVEQGGDERLVAVRPDVLSDVEHAVGNLLQRMHHAARTARAGVAGPDERLQTALDDLERLLELLFDYVSPVDVQVRSIDAQRVAESLAVQLRGQGAGEVALDVTPGLAVLGDLRALGRSFQLLTQGCANDWSPAGPVSIAMRHDVGGGRLELSVRVAGALAPAVGAQCTLAMAVAARLLELQGGELRQRPSAGCACTVVLATAS